MSHADPPARPAKVFYAYARQDAEYRLALANHLVNLRDRGLIEDWFDGLIAPGEEWDVKVREALYQADIILLLISADFLNSKYAAGVEMVEALARHREGSARVIPIMVRPVYMEGHPLRQLQWLPRNGAPISGWAKKDHVYTQIARELETAARTSQVHENRVHLTRVPRPPSISFVARRDFAGVDLVEKLGKELGTQSQQIVALWGAGGLGKTTLAAEVARSLIREYKGRVVWVSADGNDSFGLATFVGEIAEQLHYPSVSGIDQETLSRTAEAIGSRATLIVLDNFETISRLEQKACFDWLHDRVQCAALLTTRERMEGARNILLEPMLPEEARKYVFGMLEQVQFRELIVANSEKFMEISENNPLVLQWLVAQVSLAQDPNEVIRELLRGQGDAARRVFDRSFHLPQTGDDGRNVLLSLSLFFPSSASREALSHIAGLDPKPQKVNRALAALASLRLVQATSSGRLKVEGLTREFAKSYLEDSPNKVAFVRRFVGFFEDFCAEREATNAANHDALEMEVENLMKAARLAREIDVNEFVFSISGTIATPATGMLAIRGKWREAVELNTMSFDLARQKNDTRAVQFFGHNLGALLASQFEAGEAELPLRASLDSALGAQDYSGASQTMIELAGLSYREHKLDDARRLYEEALQLAKRSYNAPAIGVCLHQLGMLALDQGRPEEARTLFVQSLSVKQEGPESVSLALTLNQIGVVAEASGNNQEAAHAYRFAFQILDRLKSPASSQVREAWTRVTDGLSNSSQASSKDA